MQLHELYVKRSRITGESIFIIRFKMLFKKCRNIFKSFQIKIGTWILNNWKER